jgi:hypothetical protein
LLVGRPRDEQQQRRRPHAPDLIPLDEQIKKQRPLFGVAMRVEDAPRMRIACEGAHRAASNSTNKSASSIGSPDIARGDHRSTKMWSIG